MNSLLYKITLLLTLVLISFLSQAQVAGRNQNLKERITQAKLKEIQRGLNLTNNQLTDLTPIYKRYESELNTLISKDQAQKFRMNPDSLSTEEIDQFVVSRLDNAVTISTIRRKYYPEFKTVLTPQQVMKLYQSEAKLRKKVMEEFRRRFGNQ